MVYLIISLGLRTFTFIFDLLYMYCTRCSAGTLVDLCKTTAYLSIGIVEDGLVGQQV